MDIQSNLSILDTNITKSDIQIEEKRKIAKQQKRNILEIATKRGMDLVVGTIGMILLLPITLFVAITNTIKGDKGPIFFSQERIGKDGKIFKMYKYRTMVVGAEEILQKHIQEKTEIGREYIENKKIRNDPRITKIGSFLRKSSLDEFPQFINVLKGEMSLVGPRPYLPIEKEDMAENYQYIVKMKPGLTGPWQVAGRNKLGFEDRLRLDTEYYHKKNLKKDIKMIIQTIEVIYKRKGAM